MQTYSYSVLKRVLGFRWQEFASCFNVTNVYIYVHVYLWLGFVMGDMGYE